MSSGAALAGSNNAGHYLKGGAYQITFNHELDFVEVPLNANSDLYGSDHFNYYTLRNDLDPYNGSGLSIVHAEVIGDNLEPIDTKGHAESYGTFVSYYPDDAFSDLNDTEEVNIVYEVENRDGKSCKSLLTIQVIPSLYTHVTPEVNATIWDSIRVQQECWPNINISKVK